MKPVDRIRAVAYFGVKLKYNEMFTSEFMVLGSFSQLILCKGKTKPQDDGF